MPSGTLALVIKHAPVLASQHIELYRRMAEHKAQMAQHVVPSQGGIKTNAMPVDCKVQDDCDGTIVDLPLQELSPAPELRKVLPSATAADVNPHA